MIPVIEGIARPEPPADLDRHHEGSPSPRRRSTPAPSYVNDVTAFRARSRARRPGRRPRRRLLPDAHARRAAHDAGRPALRRRRRRRQGVPARSGCAFAVDAGVAEERIQLDPGIGFGKTLEHNLELLRRLDELVALGRPIVIGTSRKSFLGRITGRDVTERACAARSPRTCSRSSAARACSASTTSPPRPDALAVAAATLARDGPRPRRGLRRRRAERRRRRRARAPRSGSRSRSSGSRSTPTTASPPPSARSASGWCSTCASTSASPTR